MIDTDPRSVGRLATDAVDHFSKLLRAEMAVARAEFSEKLGEAVTGAGMLVVAGLLLLPVVTLLLFAFAAWLIEVGLRASLAYGAAAMLGLVVVGVLALFGKSKVSPSNLAPKHTQAELARDADAAARAI